MPKTWSVSEVEAAVEDYFNILHLKLVGRSYNKTENSYIISNTPSHQIQLLWGVGKPQMEAWHVLFQQEEKSSYIDVLLAKSIGVVTSPAQGSASK